MTLFSRAAVAALALASFAAPAFAASYTVDAEHSRVGFSVTHMTVSTVRGEFGTVTGAVEYDPANITATKVTATVGIASVDTRDQKRDDHLKSPDFFDATKFPDMTFTSTSVKNVKKDSFDLVGKLTIRGVTKDVTFNVKTFSPEVKDPWGNTKIGTSATAKINRQDFGVSWNSTLDSGGYVVGDEVDIQLDIEMSKNK